MKTESLQTAANTVDVLCSDLRHAHSDAIKGHAHFAEIVTLDLLAKAASLRNEIEAAVRAATTK